MWVCWVIKGLLGHSCEYQRWDQLSHDHMLLQACAAHDSWRRALARSCGIVPSAVSCMHAKTFQPYIRSLWWQLQGFSTCTNKVKLNSHFTKFLGLHRQIDAYGPPLQRAPQFGNLQGTTSREERVKEWKSAYMCVLQGGLTCNNSNYNSGSPIKTTSSRCTSHYRFLVVQHELVTSS